MEKLIVYLAGAIRDGHAEDIEWREAIIARCRPLAVFLNPLGGKRRDAQTGKSSFHGLVESSAAGIVKQDFWSIDRAHLVIFNFQALSQGYPNIGTLVEFGRATARGCLIYSILEPEYAGHENPIMFKLHPFLEQNSALIFPTVEKCAIFLERHLPTLSGWAPSYGGCSRNMNRGIDRSPG